MASILPDTSMFEWLFGSTTLIGVHWLLPLIVCVFIMAIVTVEMQKWKIMLLPTLAALGAVGLTTSPIIYILASIIFANETFHVEVIGNVLRGAGEKITGFNKQNRALRQLATKKFELQAKLDSKKIGSSTKRASTVTGFIAKSVAARQKAESEIQESLRKTPLHLTGKTQNTFDRSAIAIDKFQSDRLAQLESPYKKGRDSYKKSINKWRNLGTSRQGWVPLQDLKIIKPKPPSKKEQLKSTRKKYLTDKEISLLKKLKRR